MVEFEELDTETAHGFLKKPQVPYFKHVTGSYLKEIKKLGYSFIPFALFS